MSLYYHSSVFCWSEILCGRMETIVTYSRAFKDDNTTLNNAAQVSHFRRTDRFYPLKLCNSVIPQARWRPSLMYNWIYSLSLTDSINIFHILFRDCENAVAANCFWLLILGIFFDIYVSLLLSTSLYFCLFLSRQALFVFMALSFARDEIIWLLRHADNIQKKSTDDFIDKYANMHIYNFLPACVAFVLDLIVCCVLQTHSRVDLLHGGAQSSRQEVRPCDAAILRPVPVRLWCRGAEWTGAGTNTHTHALQILPQNKYTVHCVLIYMAE